MFPPPTIASGDQADELKAKELQVSSLERQAILDFEMHLAAATNKATITESNSLLLAQLVIISSYFDWESMECTVNIQKTVFSDFRTPRFLTHFAQV